MYIDSVPNRSSPPAVLLRESYRDSGRVKKRTLANLSKLPTDAIQVLRRVLRGELLVNPEDAFTCVRSLPHGHIAAVLGTLIYSDNQDENLPTIRMRESPPLALGGRA